MAAVCAVRWAAADSGCAGARKKVGILWAIWAAGGGLLSTRLTRFQATACYRPVFASDPPPTGVLACSLAALRRFNSDISIIPLWISPFASSRSPRYPCFGSILIQFLGLCKSVGPRARPLAMCHWSLPFVHMRAQSRCATRYYSPKHKHTPEAARSKWTVKPTLHLRVCG